MVTIDYEYSDNPSHPNYQRWMRSRELSFKKGKFIKSILIKSITLKNKKILDLGSGFGGTLINFMESDVQKYNTKYAQNNIVDSSATALPQNDINASKRHSESRQGRDEESHSIKFVNMLFSVDHSIAKLKKQKKLIANCFFICASAEALPFKLNYFDVIILQDSLEHFDEHFETLTGIVKNLAPDGIIYLSTPNRYSLFNILSDPHWGFPVVGLFSRNIIKKYFIPIFRRGEITRPGIAELLSLNQLNSMFRKLNLSAVLHTQEAVDALFSQPDKIIWSNLHVRLLKIVVNLRLIRLITLFANNNFGLINRYLTPTFYFTIQRNSIEI